MFEQLFRYPGVVERYRAAPLARDRLRYLVHLAGAGAHPTTLRALASRQLALVRLLDVREDRPVRREQLENVDWEAETLRGRLPKPGRTHLYPLSRPVGEALLRCLRESRPRRAKRVIFLMLQAPIRPLSALALWGVVSRRLWRLGIDAPKRGPHALRHACAQHLLDRGLSMKAVGDHLGHRSPASTVVYARVHLAALRAVVDFELEGLA